MKSLSQSSRRLNVLSEERLEEKDQIEQEPGRDDMR